MASHLSEAMQRLHLDEEENDGTIDDILFRQIPRKRRRQDPEELRADLEKQYLSPSTKFSAEWLNRLQQ